MKSETKKTTTKAKTEAKKAENKISSLASATKSAKTNTKTSAKVASKASISVKKPEKIKATPKTSEATVKKAEKATKSATPKKVKDKKLRPIKNKDLKEVNDLVKLSTFEKKKAKSVETVEKQNITDYINQVDEKVVSAPASTRKRVKSRKPISEATRFKPSVDKGLTSEQVSSRYEQGYTNEIISKTTKSYFQIIFGNIFTFFNCLCFFVAGALVAVKSYNNLIFLVVIVANIAISIIQEIKAKKTVQKITLLTAPVAHVIRDGVEEVISVKDIVLDDIVKLGLGSQISADCIVMDGELEVNESLLTGESDAIKKKKGDILYAGSYVVSGKCLARVDKIGDENYSSKLVTKAQSVKKNESELLKNMRFIMRVISIIIIPLCVVSFLTNKANSDTIREAIVNTSGNVIGMIPAGMFLLTSMALAVGVIKLAKRKTLVQDLYSIEMLSRVDMLCLDKTGTITDGTMKVNSVITLPEAKLNYTLRDIIGSMLSALEDNNQTSQALLAHFGYSRELIATEVLPFSSARKLSAVSFKNGETYVYGAPEFVCKKRNAEVEKQVQLYSQKGFRVLLLAKCKGQIDKEKLPSDPTPVALIVIEDHIRESAYDTIKWFKENDVAIRIISGDNPLTVSEIAKRVGVPDSHKFISLEGMNNKQVVEAASKYTIFGRVTPEQKSTLIKALKAQGHKVAMTGDGVNDILALKESDCSIAMASGSEATRNVANVVLLNSDFSSMPSIVAEGRRVINNISKSSSLFLMKTFFMIFVTLFCIVMHTLSPFMPNQLFLLESFVIGIPSFVLALQPNKDRIKGNFLANVISKALPGAIIFSLIFLSSYFFNMIFNTGDQVSTMSSLGICAAGLLILFRICKPFDVVRTILFISMVALSIIVLLIVPPAFFNYDKLLIENALLVVCMVEFSGFIYASIVRACEAIFNKPKKPNTVQNIIKK